MHLEKTSRFSNARRHAGDPTRSRAEIGANIGKAPRALATALLGLAAVVMLLAPAPDARANDLSGLPCTAGDVEIVGSGVVVNEPCVCPSSGFFNATVQFTVRNNTSSGRYCIALHLVPDGSVLTSTMDLVLRDSGGSSTAPGKTGSEKYHDTVMFASIPNFPCSTGLVCFGQAGVVSGKCSPGGCTTISWNTSNTKGDCPVADQSPPGGQCRHQQVCVIGFGASLACITNCTVTCNGTSTLKACVSAPMNRGPFTLKLTGNDGSSQTQSTFGDTSGVTCLNFNVSPALSPSTTYTLTVTDKDGCTRTATTSLEVRSSPTAYAGPDQAKCGNTATTAFTLAGTAGNGTPAWSVLNGPATIADASNLSSGVTFTGTGTATLRLTVSNSPCPAKTDDVVLTVNASPTAGAGLDQAKCSAGATTPFTLAGTAGNGTASWSVLNGPATIADASNLNSGVTFSGVGTATLRLTVTSNAKPACTSATDDVVLTVNANPTANAGPNQVKCAASATTPFTLAGTASNGTASWSVLNGPVTIDNPSNLNSGVTFTGGGTAKLRLTVSSNSNPQCATATSDVQLDVLVTSVTITPPSSPGCNGVLAYTASVDGGAGCTFSWSIDGVSPASFTTGGLPDDARVARVSGSGGSQLEFRALDNFCHTIEVTATCSGAAGTCTGTASTTAKQCVGGPQSCTK